MAKIIAPVVTIFNEEEKPDYAGNKKVIDFLIEGGLDGILVLGSAGEFPDLNEQERLDFFRFYAEYVNGRVELLAGTGCIRYADTLALSNAVYELGYTPMVISPYYFEMDQEKLFVYYDRLAKDQKAGGSNPSRRTIERISEPYIVWGTVFVQTKRHSLP